MQILLEISLVVKECELRKLTTYLKYKYTMVDKVIDYNKEY